MRAKFYCDIKLIYNTDKAILESELITEHIVAAAGRKKEGSSSSQTVNNLQRRVLNSLNAELNPICHLLALLGAHHILHVSRIRVNYKRNVQ